MIRSVLILFTILLSNSLMAITYEPVWTQDFKKNVIMTCSEDEFQCEDYCGQKTCEIKEKVCRNCIGSNVLVTHIFRDMGRSFVNSGNEVSYYEVMEVLQSGRFASFTSKSIYNIVERFDAPKLRTKFQSLCENGTEYPVVIFSTKKTSRILDEIKYVVCGNKAFEMSDEAFVDVNKNANFIYNSLY